MDHIGIDVHKKESQLCILSEDGQRREPRVRTTPARFADVLGDRPRARILLDASTESEWVMRCLERLGHEVIVADPNFAPMYAARTRKIKTDRRDARALAEVARGRPARQGPERACCWSMKMSSPNWSVKMSPHGDMGDIPHEPKEVPRPGLVKLAVAGQITNPEGAAGSKLTIRQFQRVRRRRRPGGSSPTVRTR